MRSLPFAWDKTLAQLGFRRRVSKKRLANYSGRRVLFEQLERRELLANDLMVVTTFDDVAVAGTTTDNFWSLREALVAANSDNQNDSDRIEFSPDLRSGTIALNPTLGELKIESNVTIAGLGVDKVKIQADGSHRVLLVQPGVTATLSGLTITGGGNVGDGAGINNRGNLTLDHVNVVGNSTLITWTGTNIGGGIYSFGGGSLHVTNSTIDGNSARYGGGLYVVLQGTAQFDVANSTISHNVGMGRDEFGNPVSGAGGGLHVQAEADATGGAIIKNSTISGNFSTAGAGIAIRGVGTKASIVNSTIYDNHTRDPLRNDAPLTGGAAGGIHIWSGSTLPVVTLQNSIVAGNTTSTYAAYPDVYGNVAGASGNLSVNNILGIQGVASGTDGFTGLTNDPRNGTGDGRKNYVGSLSAPVNPNLAALGDFGGDTKTHAIAAATSLAVNGGDNFKTDAAGLSTDQRGGNRYVATAAAGIVDIGAYEYEYAGSVDAAVAKGDFNGDGRTDTLRYNASPPLRQLFIEEPGTDGVVRYAPAGTLAPESGSASVWSKFIAGDFNGDGRDDLWIRDDISERWRLELSDGTAFFRSVSISTPAWPETYVGDFDGDGFEELIGRTTNTSAWNILQFDPATSVATLATDGVSLSGFSDLYVFDLDRDGKDDLLSASGRASMAAGTTSNVAFGANVDLAANTVQFNTTTHTVTADPVGTALREFEWVYNNVKLELYPGLMKGPTGTERTLAGNSFDQAAMLQKRLDDKGLTAELVVGDVTVTEQSLRDWIGTTTGSAALAIVLGYLDSAASQLTIGAPITFKHSWVRVQLPTGTGGSSQWVTLDPSWKFTAKPTDTSPTFLTPQTSDDDATVDFVQQLPDVSHNAGIFDEFDYFALDSAYVAPVAGQSVEKDHRLPLEMFEDQMQDWLAVKAPGTSLADYVNSRPIIARSFTSLSAITREGVSSAVVTNTYSSSFTLDSKWKHLASIEIDRVSSTTSTQIYDSQTFFAGDAGDKSYNVTFTTNGSGNPYVAVLTLGSTPISISSANNSFAADQHASVTVSHYSPTGLFPRPANLTGTPDRTNTYTVARDEVASIGFDANQISRASLDDLRSTALLAISNDVTVQDYQADIDEVTSYAIMKYWYNFNRSNEAIASLTDTIGGQQRVGSGIVKSKVNLLTSTGGQHRIDYLPFGMAPDGFGIDLPNSNQAALDRSTGGIGGAGSTSAEATQLVGFNASALESDIVEEVIGSESISTTKGLQRAWQRSLGTNANGDLVAIDNVVELKATFQFISPTALSRTAWSAKSIAKSGTGEDEWTQSAAQVGSESAILSFLQHHAVSQGGANPTAQSIADLFLTGPNNPQGQTSQFVQVRILVPQYKTEMGSWEGSVYFAETVTPTSYRALFAIAKEGGSVTNGGFSGGQVLPVEAIVQPGNSTFATYAGDPVNPANGNLIRDETDIVYPNRGVPLTFARHYDSQNLDDVGFGVGWTHSFSDVIYSEGVNRVWLDSKGVRHVFEKDGTAWKIPKELKGKVTLWDSTLSIGSVDFIFEDTEGMQYSFTKVDYPPETTPGMTQRTWVGRLASIVDKNGDGVKVTLITNGPPYPAVIADIRDASRKIVISGPSLWEPPYYHEVTAWSANQQLVKWHYDMVQVGTSQSAGLNLYRLTQATGDFGGANQITRYGHKLDGPAKGLIEKITEPDNSWHQYEYYSNKRIFRVNQGEAADTDFTKLYDVQSYSYNLFRNSAEFTDERGNVETYIHRTDGLLTKQIHSDRSSLEYQWGTIGQNNQYLMTKTVDEVGAIEDFTYGSTEGQADFKQLKTATEKHFPGNAALATAAVTTYTYETHTGPYAGSSSVDVKTASVRKPGGAERLTTYIYDTNPSTVGAQKGKLLQLIDAAGNTTTYQYFTSGPNVGLVLQTTRTDQALQQQFTTTFAYDAAGNVTQQTFGQGPGVGPVASTVAGTTYQYNAFGQVVRAEDATHVVTKSVYDAIGRLVRTGPASATATDIYPDPRYWTQITPDALGRTTTSVDALGRSTSFAYDRLGRVTLQTNPDDTKKSFVYDGVGNLTSSTDELGRVTKFVYDSRNRLIQTILPDGAAARTKYDGAGRVAATIDAAGNESRAEYDALGRVITTVSGRVLEADGDEAALPPGSTQVNATTTTKYNEFGDVVESIDPNGNSTVYEYDALGRVVVTKLLMTGGDRSIATQTVPRSATNAPLPLNDNTRLVKLRVNEYDAQGRVVRTVDFDVVGLATYAVPPNNVNLLNYADSLKLLGPGNAKLVQSTQFEYDAAGRLKTTTYDDLSTTTTDYDAAGRVESQTDELGNTHQFIYDYANRGLLVQEKSADPDGPNNEDGDEINLGQLVTTYQYDAAGNRVATGDSRGGTTRVEYDRFNRPVTVVDAIGNRTRSVYDAAGQMIGSVDATGAMSYTLFDERGRAIQQWQADPDGDGSQPAPHTSTKYDETDHKTTTTDERGFTTKLTVDGLGRVVKREQDTNLLTSAGQVKAGSATTATTEYVYDDNGNLKTESVNLGTEINPNNHVTTYLYDRADRQTLQISPMPGPGGDGVTRNNLVVQSVYDGYGNETATVDGNLFGSVSAPLGVYSVFARTAHREFDNRNRLVKEVRDFGDDNTNGVADYLNDTTTYGYDATGNRTSMGEGDEHGIVRTTTYNFDRLNRPLKTIENDGAGIPSVNKIVTTNHYNSAGDLARTAINENVTEDERRELTRYAYDALGRVVATTQEGFLGTTPVKRISTTEYDALGRVVVTSDPLHRLNTTEYDRLGRVVRTVAPDPDGAVPVGGSATGPGSQPRQIVEFAYDAAGNLATQTTVGANTPSAEIERFYYDAQSRQAVSVDGLGQATVREYDKVGNLKSFTDAAGNVTTYEYDGADRLIKEIITLGAVTATRRIAYDQRGNILEDFDKNDLSSVADGFGRRTTYTYDRLDRPITESWRTAGSNLLAAPTDVITSTYDALGRKVNSRQDHYNGTTIAWTVAESTEYDNLDRVVFERNSIPAAGGSPEYLTTEAPKIEFSYEYLFNQTPHHGYMTGRHEIVAGVQQGVVYSVYGAFGTLIKVIDVDDNGGAGVQYKWADAQFTYDKSGALLTTLREFAPASAYAVDPLRAELTSYAYDGAGNLSTLSHAAGSRASGATGFAFDTLVRFDYAHDLAGRISTQTTAWNTAVAGLGARPTNLVESFSYDKAGQLTYVDQGGATSGWYQYGTDGNNGNPTLQYEWNGGGILHPVTAAGAYNRRTSDDLFTYEYDNEGNLTRQESKSNPAVFTIFTWDQRNRLTRVETSTGVFVDYRYNPSGELVYRKGTGDGSATSLAWANGELALTTVGNGVSERFQYGPTGELLYDEAFSQLSLLGGATEKRRVVLGDHQNSTRVTLDGDDASVRQWVDYNPFGDIRTLGGPIAPSPSLPYHDIDAAFAHHGDYVDNFTGYELKGARWYAPKLGRFLSEDPLGFADGGNPYRFAGNDPINFADPTGTTQAGYPLSSRSMAGGYSGGKVVSQPIYNSVATAFAGGLGGLGGFASSAATASYGASRSSSSSYSTPSYSTPSFSDTFAALSAPAPSRAPAATGFSNSLFGQGATFGSLTAQSNLAYRSDIQAIDRRNQREALDAEFAAQQSSVVGAFGRGLRTTGRGIVNGGANAAWSTATLGFGGPVQLTNVDAFDRQYGYNYIAGGSQLAGEVGIGLLTGGLASAAGKAGRAGQAARAALAYDTLGNAFGAGRGTVDAYNNGLGVGNSVAIVGGGLGLGGNFAAGSKALGELASDAGRIRVGLDFDVLKSPQFNAGAPLNAVKISLAPKVNLNSNIAVGNFGIYEINVNGALYKIGKADLDRVTQISGLPTRVHQQIRELTKVFGAGKVTPGQITPLGQTTTAAAKAAEVARIQAEVSSSGFVPLGNWKSYRPNK